MDDRTNQEAVPVPRNRVFVLRDGTFVVQWEPHRVQALLTGRYYPFSQADFETHISDYELNQLKHSAIVHDYDGELVYLVAQPSIVSKTPDRSFYLNTTLHKGRYKEVEAALGEQGLLEAYSVRIHDVFVIVRGQAGRAFQTFDEAERARELIVKQLPDLLDATVVAFLEVNTLP